MGARKMLRFYGIGFSQFDLFRMYILMGDNYFQQIDERVLVMYVVHN